MNNKDDIVSEIVNINNQILKFQNDIVNLETKKAIVFKNKFEIENLTAQNDRFNYSRFYYSKGKNVGQECDFYDSMEKQINLSLDNVELLIGNIEEAVNVFKKKISDCYNKKASLNEQLSKFKGK